MADELTQEEFERIYGRVAPLTLTQLRDLFQGADFRWWICGGWSLELDEQPRRQHSNVEVGIARAELPKVRRWLADYHLWDIHAGALVHMSAGVELADDHEPRDEDDFDAVVPRPSDDERRWLRAAIELTEPVGNPWLERL